MSCVIWLLTDSDSAAVSDVDAGTYLNLGCQADTATPHDISNITTAMGSGLTLESCASYCSGNGYPYAGLEFATQCNCGDFYGLQGPSSGKQTSSSRV